MKPKHTTSQPFPTTKWTLVAKVSQGNEEEKSTALDELCKHYWPPVYAFFRSKGNSSADAEDLTQGFFARLLAKDQFSKIEQSKGKLRSFILKSASNFAVSDWHRKHRKKRGGAAKSVSLDFTPETIAELDAAALGDSTPEIIFDRQWALTVLRKVFRALQERYKKKGQADLFAALQFAIFPGTAEKTYAAIAADLGMTEGTVKTAAHRLRNRYAEELRQSVADTLSINSDIEEEIRYLMKVFR